MRPGQQTAGVLLGAAGGVSYGFTILFGRVLAKAGIGSPTALGVRFAFAAAALLGVVVATRRPVLPASGERVRLFLLGGIGYGVESTCFYLGLTEGSAAAVALLFYAYPAIVTVLDLLTGGTRPGAGLLAALGLTVGGTAVVVSAGSDVNISGAGIAWSLASALSYSLYVIAGARLVHRTDALTSGAWVAAGAAISLLGRGLVTGSLEQPAGQWDALVGTGLATAAAFTFLFAALRRIGPARTSVVMTIEAFSAIVLARVFLDEPLDAVQALGGVAILLGAVVIGASRAAPELETAAPEAP